MTKLLKTLRRNDEGATAIEYGLIAALIAVALIATLTTFSGSIDTMFSNLGTTVSAQGTAPTSPE